METEMIQNYLNGLVKEAQKKETGAKLSSLNMEELASIMGVKLAMTKCAGCGSEMHKSGTMLKCSACGMEKKAIPMSLLAGGASTAGKGLAAGALSGGRAIPRMAQTAQQAAAPLLKGVGGGALTAAERASTQGPLRRAAVG
jgi:hypothetical protein